MKFVLSIFLVIFTQQFVFSQGCSSAGFCTMGSLKANQSYSSIRKVKINYIELSHLGAMPLYRITSDEVVDELSPQGKC